MAKVIVIIIVCLILISGLIAYDFSKFNSNPAKEDMETEAYYQYTWQEHDGSI